MNRVRYNSMCLFSAFHKGNGKLPQAHPQGQDRTSTASKPGCRKQGACGGERLEAGGIWRGREERGMLARYPGVRISLSD